MSLLTGVGPQSSLCVINRLRGYWADVRVISLEILDGNPPLEIVDPMTPYPHFDLKLGVLLGELAETLGCKSFQVSRLPPFVLALSALLGLFPAGDPRIWLNIEVRVRFARNFMHVSVFTRGCCWHRHGYNMLVWFKGLRGCNLTTLHL